MSGSDGTVPAAVPALTDREQARACAYFGALQALEAEAAVDRCAAALAEFEAEALAAEAPEPAAPAAPEPGRRLSAIDLH